MWKTRILTLTALYAAASICGRSQADGPATQAFEVAAIHPDVSGANSTRINTPDGGRLSITNCTVNALIRIAYDIQGVQIAGGPNWVDSERYDIEAKTGRPENIKPDELKLLMQNLLADRFRLKIHKEPRELTFFALVVVKDGANAGPRLRQHSGGAGTSLNDRKGSDKTQLIADNVSMALLASYLGDQLERVVVDKTGVGGGYDFTLEWSADQAAGSTGPSILTGIQEQLGLKLESTRGPVESFVIDHLERPSEN